MRPINLKAQAIMDRLTAGITSENNHTRIDNNKPDSGYMPVVVEWIGDCKIGDVFSIAHYFEQNGDLMADPEMTFLRATASGKYFPMSYKLDSLNVYREGVIWEDGEPRYINAKEQRDEATFAGEWMENIRFQQFMKRNRIFQGYKACKAGILGCMNCDRTPKECHDGSMYERASEHSNFCKNRTFAGEESLHEYIASQHD